MVDLRIFEGYTTVNQLLSHCGKDINISLDVETTLSLESNPVSVYIVRDKRQPVLATHSLRQAVDMYNYLNK